MLKNLSLIVTACVLSLSVHADTDLAAKNALSKQAIMAFGKSLKHELTTAMKAGGPVNAIGVCNLKAPEIASQVSGESGFELSRTSLKNRNPANAATDWQRQVMEDFEAAKQSGQNPAEMEFSTVVDTDDGKEYRYMKPIATGEVCLKCHGSSIAEEVTAKLKELYPDDKATGFSEGDLRGAFKNKKKIQ
ncbi:MAG: DUF3365 domain-containing protein [Gammaproteobacteria bacterium]|nr:DUF3365 domain-containing protein [Gammaproteobacteria bacterium]